MNFISMASGIEAASVAFKPLGWKALALSEIEKFPSAVLKHHYPEVPNVGDLTAFDWSVYRGLADLVCAGFPCQAFSIAGLGKSLEDNRGNLSLVGVKAIRTIRPKWVLLEQVPGVLNKPDNPFGCILAGLAGAEAPLLPGTRDGRWRNAGVVSGHKEAYGLAWRVLDAQHFGVPQRRRRVFVVGYLGDWKPAAEVLFEPEGLRGYPPQSGEAGQGAAGGVAKGSGIYSFKHKQGARARSLAIIKDGTSTLESDGKTPAIFAGGVECGVGENGGSRVFCETGPGWISEGVGCLRAEGENRPSRPTHTVMAHGQGGAEVLKGKCPTLNCNHEAPILYDEEKTDS